MNTFSPHISFADLADLAEQRTTISAAVREHLATCASCLSQLESLRKTIGLMRSDTTEDAPKPLVEHARNIFRAGAALNREPSMLRIVLAALTFDSLTNAPAFGLRSQTS